MIFYVILDLCIWVLNTRKNRVILFLLYYYCYTIILASATLAIETKQEPTNIENIMDSNKKLLLKTTSAPDTGNFYDDEYPEYEDYLNKSGGMAFVFFFYFSYQDLLICIKVNKSRKNFLLMLLLFFVCLFYLLFL